MDCQDEVHHDDDRGEGLQRCPTTAAVGGHGDPMTRAPSMQEVCDFLATLRGSPIYRVPLVDSTGKVVGNNGDALIHLGADRLFERYALNFVDDPHAARWLMIGGNGGMLEKFSVIPGIFRRYWSEFLETPLLMMPSTFYFPTQPMTGGLPDRTAEVRLFCRERVSYDHLRNDCQLPSCCEVSLSHDTAFALDDSPLVERYRDRPGKHVLIVERDDGEHPSRFADRSPDKRRLRQYIPRIIKKPLYPLRAFLFSKRASELREQCEAIVREEHADLTELPRLVRDVSRSDFCSFDEFCDAVADAAIVFTSRLHVGIFAAMLGKPTYIVAGPYHKIRAIYEHSMSGYRNATLISWGQRRQS